MHALGEKVVAEGEEAELDRLRRMGSDFAQGRLETAAG